MSVDEEVTELLGDLRRKASAALDQEVFELLATAKDEVLTRALPQMMGGGMQESRFTAYRDAARAILEARLFNRLGETMIRLDATAGRLQKAIFVLTIVGVAVAIVGVVK